MKRFLSLLVALMMFSVLATSAFAAEQKEAMVRIVHASPDAPAVDVVVDGKTVVTNAAFKAATDYVKLSAGEHEVQIFATGTVAENKPVISQKLNVEAGKSYTVAAINKVANLELLVMNDEAMTTEGKTKVRVAHLSPDAPAVDVALKGGDALFANAPFKGVTDFKEVDPATLDLEVRAAGTNNVVLNLPQTELKANTLYTVLAVGFAQGEPKLDAIVLTNMSESAMPTSMPKTGNGGASNVWLYAAAAGLLAGTILMFRKTKTN
ncbi:DUF4397 domain-containing protein [Ectobacillus sp. JY-23]|uniref:DUF4397 domain-containing protein n=1 Tax=Ectobacillus sp. JY-23 TaxID=2933872 RepID=UPI001FF62003|nr:DUF4397 domain-containing protein [Ectobacillus sp. JY-23]UOY93333.1 DUF4397 domain-containing protein [Ectobacillus sp. JY-23]